MVCVLNLWFLQVADGSADTKLKGKAACTKFRRISTNGEYSVVHCEPLTGRTHQVKYSLLGNSNQTWVLLCLLFQVVDFLFCIYFICFLALHFCFSVPDLV